MLLIIVISFLQNTYSYDITLGQICSCYRVTYQPDCLLMKNYCNWQGNACVEYNCTTISSYNTCITANKCAWVNNSCSDFTKCSDYSVTSNSSCAIQGGGCAQAAIGSNCIEIISNSTGAAPCSEYTTNSSCSERQMCTWDGTQCRTTTCSDYTTNSTCFIAQSTNQSVIKTCEWTSSCKESSSVNLNSTTCNQYSKMMYTWNSDANKCISCAFSYLIFSLLSILLI